MEEWLDSPLIIIAAITILGFLGSIGVFIWKTSRWVGGVENGLGRVERGVGAANTAAAEDRSSLRSFMDEIRNDIKKIFLSLPPPVVKSSSPVTLTELGEKIATSFGAADWAKELAPTIANRIVGMAAFEIDEFCQEYVHVKVDDTHKTQVTRVAYEFGIDRQKVLNVLRVVLRDELILRVQSSGDPSN